MAQAGKGGGGCAGWGESFWQRWNRKVGTSMMLQPHLSATSIDFQWLQNFLCNGFSFVFRHKMQRLKSSLFVFLSVPTQNLVQRKSTINYCGTTMDPVYYISMRRGQCQNLRLRQRQTPRSPKKNLLRCEVPGFSVQIQIKTNQSRKCNQTTIDKWYQWLGYTC